MTLNCILSRDRWLNRNYKYNYRIIYINVLLLPVRQLEKIATFS